MFHSNFYLSYMNSNGVDNNGWEDRWGIEYNLSHVITL